MDKTKWRETKKEFEIDAKGEKVLKRITVESRSWSRKEVWDIALRILAALSIAVPFIVFIVQRNIQIEDRREQAEYEIFINTSVQLHSLVDFLPQSPEDNEARDKLMYDLEPKLLVINNQDVLNSYYDAIDYSILGEKHLLIENTLVDLVYFVYGHESGEIIPAHRETSDEKARSDHNDLRYQILSDRDQLSTSLSYLKEIDLADSLSYYKNYIERYLDTALLYKNIQLEIIDQSWVGLEVPTINYDSILAITDRYLLIADRLKIFLRRDGRKAVNSFDSVIRRANKYFQ